MVSCGHAGEGSGKRFKICELIWTLNKFPSPENLFIQFYAHSKPLREAISQPCHPPSEWMMSHSLGVSPHVIIILKVIRKSGQLINLNQLNIPFFSQAGRSGPVLDRGKMVRNHRENILNPATVNFYRPCGCKMFTILHL